LDDSLTTRNQFLALAFLCVVFVVFWWHSLVSTFELAFTNDAYTHILLILPLSAALIYADSKYAEATGLAIRPKPDLRYGAVLLAVALLAGSYVRWGMAATPPGDIRLSLSMCALVVWWIGSVLFCFGARTLRSFLFPLCFLFWMVPIPDFALNGIVEFLQQQSAVAARIMFRAIGVPATQDGIMVYIPNLGLEVARECSSIRSSVMLVVSTMVLAHLFLRSWWRQLLLIAASIPLSVAKNGLRIVTIGELGTRVDPGFLNGNLHHHGGIIFFGIAVIAVLVLLWILRRTEPQVSIKPFKPVLE
jgi:exosortase